MRTIKSRQTPIVRACRKAVTAPFLFALLMGPLWLAQAQPVSVTVALDADSVAAGQSTMLRVYAQVMPELQTNVYQIFSWYVDVLNGDGAVASANYDAMTRSASDKNPATSSSGITEGANRRSIYDTLIDFPGAGVIDPVELMAIPVTGQSGGVTRFEVRAGSGVPELIGDFFVGPTFDGGGPLIGGDYTQAFADLEVTQSCVIELAIERVNGGGPGQPLNLTFVPCTDFDHTVEFSDELSASISWTALPGAPHNTGLVTTTNTVANRFFRVRAQEQ